MTPERWQQVKEVLQSVLELAPSERAAFLDQACDDDQALRQEVESLLAADDGIPPEQKLSLGLLNQPAFAVPGNAGAAEVADVSPGRWVGPYRIIEQIGAGGMGEVYRAVRDDDQYRKQVAIKLVRAGQDAALVVSRFKNERQILAGLDHPNIARLLDGGTTKEGAAYFVMDLIDGEPIDQHCAHHKLAVTERLKLFLLVCSAVQHAHQRLIIHRDIKPGNILVTSEGVPKLLDFGIAKILDVNAEGVQAETTLTIFRILTPAYASPEQVKGEPITTASDVYSLGVVLYELLTGNSPYQVTSHTPQEMVRAVCEFEPQRPSTALRRTAAESKPDATQTAQPSVDVVGDGSLQKLSKRLSGDLDNIVLKALRKEPKRRYASVEQFAEDVRRHLESLPVIARKDTVRYRTSKFVARHITGVVAAALVAVTLIAALGITLREARIARVQQARAERRFNDVRKLANSLIFEVHDSIQQLPGATAARKLIIQRAQEYLDGLAQESRSDPALLRELAAAYVRLATVQGNPADANVGDTSKALENNRKAVELLEAGLLLDPSNRDMRRELAESNIDLASIQWKLVDNSGRKQSLDRAVQILEDLAASNPEDLKAVAVLGEACAAMGYFFNAQNDLPHGLIYQQKALAVAQRLVAADPQNEHYQTQLSFAHKRVASVLMVQNQLEQALEHEQAALAIDEAQLALHPDNARVRYNITLAYSDTGFVLGRQGDFDGAINYYRKALVIRAALVAADPQDKRAQGGLANTYNYIGENLERKMDFSGALDSYQKALAMRESLLRADLANEPLRFSVANTQSAIAGVYATLGLKSDIHANEIQYCRESEDWYRRALPAWLQRKAQGKLFGDEVDALPKIYQKLDECRLAIARLDHAAESPRP